MNLRELIAYLYLLSLLVFGGGMMVMLGVFSLPRQEVVYLGELTDFPASETPYLVENVNGWLAHSDDRLQVFTWLTTDRMACYYTWSDVTRRFEDPCSGSKYTLDGRYIEGPALRDLDRYILSLRGDQLWVNKSRVVEGHPRLMPEIAHKPCRRMVWPAWRSVYRSLPEGKLALVYGDSLCLYQ